MSDPILEVQAVAPAPVVTPPVKVYNWFLASSQDPAFLSLRIKSVIAFAVPLIIYFLSKKGVVVTGDQVNGSVDEFVNLVAQIGMFLAALTHAYAWFRALKS